MGDIAVHSSNVAEKWAQDFFAETVRGSRFARFMGTGTNSVIQVREDMIKEAGDGITLPLITRLTVFLPHPNRSPKSTNDKEMSLRAASTMSNSRASRIARLTGSPIDPSM